MLAALAAAAAVSAAPAHLGPQHQRGDIYIPGTVGGALGLRTVIDILRAHSHTGQGQVRATRRAPRVPTSPASAVTGKYTKPYTPYKGMGFVFCAFKLGRGPQGHWSRENG